MRIQLENMPDQKPSEASLRFRLLYLKFQKYFISLPIVILALLNIGVFAFAATLAVRIFVFDHESYVRALQGLTETYVNFESYRATHQPQPLNVLEVGVIPHVIRGGGTASHDFYAHIENPNPTWLVLFTYRFASGDFQSSERSGFILPGEETYIADLGISLPTILRSASVEITNVRYQNASDYEKRKVRDANFQISNVQFLQGDGGVFSKTLFTFQNLGAASFWQVPFVVVLFSGNEVVGVNVASLEKVLSLEKRNVDLTWFEELPYVSFTRIVPQVNLYDKSVYYNPFLPSPKL
jgi:hypothetical protein